MSPSSPRYDCANSRSRNAELFGNLGLGKNASVPECADSSDNVGAKQRVAMTLTTEPAASFGVHVEHVVSLRSQKQVRRVAARAHVTFMENLKAIFDWAVMQFPRKAMDGLCPAISANDAVTVLRVPCAFPKPAIISGLVTAPKPESRNRRAVSFAHAKVITQRAERYNYAIIKNAA